MFAETTSAAIDGACTLTRLDDLSRLIWQALAGGAVSDDAAQLLAERLEARRSVVRGEIKPVGIPPGRPTIFPPRRPQRALNRSAAVARRRQLAASGPLPPALACRFTVGELAVLRIVGDEVRQHGACSRNLDEIAARAGVCRSLAKRVIREAARLGLLTVQERRRQGQKNLSNIVRIVAREWLAWIAKAPKGVGGRNIAPTDRTIKNKGMNTSDRLIAAGGRHAAWAERSGSRPGQCTSEV